MEVTKKRKPGETGNGQLDSNFSEPSSLQSSVVSSTSVEELQSLLNPLAKSQLADLLAKLGSKYPFIAEEIRSLARTDPALRKLFVRGLAWNTSSETLCAAFEEHGEIEEGAVIYDKATGKSRGYGFITYKDIESAQRALKAPSKMIDGRMVVGNLACEGLSSTTTTPDHAQRKLYIGVLSPETTSELLLNFFARYGEIEEGSVAYDKETHTSRGFGFVTFKTVEAAKKAIEDPEKMLGGRNITVKLADHQKGRSLQTQFQSSAIPVPMGMTTAYLNAPNLHTGSGTPVGYTYPPPVSGYTNAPYTSLPVGAAYASQPQTSYPQFAPKNEPSLAPTSIGGYPYYMPK